MNYTTLFFYVLFVGCVGLDAMDNPAAIVAAATTKNSEVSESVDSLKQQLEEARLENAKSALQLKQNEELISRLTGDLAAYQEIFYQLQHQSASPIRSLDKGVEAGNVYF